MAEGNKFSVPVVFADRFYMSEKALGEISSLIFRFPIVIVRLGLVNDTSVSVIN